MPEMEYPPRIPREEPAPCCRVRVIQEQDVSKVEMASASRRRMFAMKRLECQSGLHDHGARVLQRYYLQPRHHRTPREMDNKIWR
ncbi:hypothetical protein BJV74DRAFT_867888 [Russula compacta]|nr:hypothetical protein BJV74DRAFT_867888 [Russula compacta]